MKTNNKVLSLREAFSEVDWHSPNTHVFFNVQVIGVGWFIWLLFSKIFSLSPLASSNLHTIFLMIIARYFIGMWFVTVWRHRFFAHQSFRVHPWLKWVIPIIAFICSADAQRGICQWAADHIWHHKHSDKPEDVHSCKQKGFSWCHWLWVVKSDDQQGIKWSLIPHLNKMRSVRWIENRQWIGVVVGGVLFSLIGSLLSVGGFHSFMANFLFSLCGYFFSTTLLWHGTFMINSAMHLVGKQKYDTGDESRNSFITAFLTLGEGWHNNHHYHFPSLAQAQKRAGSLKRGKSELYWQGETFFEKCFDWSGISIWLLTKLGILRAL